MSNDKEAQIRKKLREISDPELGINIVDLGLIYKVNVEDEVVKILMTLTTPFCPLTAFFEQEITAKVKEIKWVKNVEISFTFDPPWDVSKMSEDARLQLGIPTS